MSGEPVLSHFQARELLAARDQGCGECRVSLDLELSRVQVAITADGILLPGDLAVTWADLKKMIKRDMSCFVVEPSGVSKISTFSELTNRVYSLCPTRMSPTMLVSGFLMHRIKDTDPQQDTGAKLAALGGIQGPVLDTCTGLGYTAIAAGGSGEAVTTVELDPAAREICTQNPWSRELFTSDHIRCLIGDTAQLVGDFGTGAFAAVIHDPPDISLGGQLYAVDFYRELRRVLTRRGRLFHYIGNPNSTKMRRMIDQAMARLRQAGFQDLRVEPEAFGVSAVA